MNIAIIGSFDFHLECVSFILEQFRNDKVVVYINSDIYSTIEYYKTLYNFDVKFCQFSNKIINNYDIVFKLTSNDPCLNHQNIISILHLQGKQRNCESVRLLSLTPYICGSNIFYTFPVFCPNIKETNNNHITMIGLYDEESFDQDTIQFIHTNHDYTFNFIIRQYNNHYEKIKSIQNVQLYIGLSTPGMVDIIHNSKYILSKKNIKHDRFSGQLGLAVSFEKPLILDSQTKNKYDLPCLPFDKKYGEIGKLDNISNYNELKNNIKAKKKEMLKHNKKIFRQFYL